HRGQIKGGSLKRRKPVGQSGSCVIEALEHRMLLSGTVLPQGLEVAAAGDPPATVTPGSGIWIFGNQFGDTNIGESIASAAEFDVFAFMPDVSGSYTISTSGALDSQLR